jgi:uncharacterized protein with HEPN domain
MSRHDQGTRLRHMLDAAREAQQLSAGLSRQRLEEDRVLTLALIRLLEVVGEAANRIPPEARPTHPDIPWQAIIGLRHRLIHGYDQVDLDVLWQILSADLPRLARGLEQILPRD